MSFIGAKESPPHPNNTDNFPVMATNLEEAATEEESNSSPNR